MFDLLTSIQVSGVQECFPIEGPREIHPRHGASAKKAGYHQR